MQKSVFKGMAGIFLCLALLLVLPSNGSKADGGEVAVNATNFPDPVFREYISQNVDTDKNGKLSESEMWAVENINVYQYGISNLKGIEFFTYLRKLECGGNQLTSIDVSKNTYLYSLYCPDNLLTKLDVSKNDWLESLSCGKNLLTSIDVSKNSHLVEFYCWDNELSSLDVSKNPNLKSLVCSENKLTSLNLGNNQALKELNCSGNQITSLDLSKNLELSSLICSENNLTSLDVGRNTKLYYFSCTDNLIEKLDVTKNTNLMALDCNSNKITILDISKNTALENLYCSSNKLTSLDVSKNTLLTHLGCGGNELTSLNLKNNTALTQLACNHNLLTSLDLSNNTALTWVDCDKNQLASLNISKCTAIEYLNCENNQIVSLDLSKDTALTNLQCENNQISYLNISNSPALKSLNLRNNQLSSLDVSKNKALEILLCDDNKLTQLNVGNNTLLTALTFDHNQVTSIDVTNCPNLLNLGIWDNKIKTVDVTKCPNLNRLSCGYNQLTSLDLSKNLKLQQLHCQGNQLKNLDVTKNTELWLLYCDENQLTQLDISRNTLLRELALNDNQFSSIDVSKCTGLIRLACNGNKIKTLDVTNNILLESLRFDSNQVTSIELSKCTNLKELYCWNNKLKNLYVTRLPKLERLSCGGNLITSLDISKCKALEELYLDGDHITDLDLSNCPGLWKIYVHNTDISTLDISNNEKLVATYKSGKKTEFDDCTEYLLNVDGVERVMLCVPETQIVYDNIKLAITSQPANVTVNSGEIASFEVKATGKGLKYLWQYKEAGKNTWTDWTSKTTAKISVAYASFRDGMSFRCVVTDASNNKVTSNVATLTYNVPLAITAQPANITVNSGEIASFEVKATGKGLKYLWQYKEAGKTEWTDWTTKKTASISVAYAAYRDGMSFRCVVTDENGKKVTSNAATLTYNIPLAITAQPASTTVNGGELANFEVKATGKGLRYLWQYKAAGSSTWTDWTSKKTAKISVAYADYRDGMSFRCVVTDANGKKVTSNAATLTYNIPLAITLNPANTTVNSGALASFEVKATGKGLSYLWQYKAAGSSTWTDWTSKKTAKISVAYADYRDGMSFRCVVTDANGKKVTSNAAVLTYEKPLAITKQPVSVIVDKNTVASFSVKATGKGLKYQWQYKNAGDADWTTWGSKTKADITVAYAAYRDGMSLRCVITDASGQTVTTNVVTLNYN
ncbi:MAG: hypothetical protein K6E47_00745 [Lachnospiraceae bacterium]|nr:hypothetical protein [Lachnospiraceae bacterium]